MVTVNNIFFYRLKFSNKFNEAVCLYIYHLCYYNPRRKVFSIQVKIQVFLINNQGNCNSVLRFSITFVCSKFEMQFIFRECSRWIKLCTFRTRAAVGNLYNSCRFPKKKSTWPTSAQVSHSKYWFCPIIRILQKKGLDFRLI